MQVLCGKEIYTESFIELTRSSQLRVSTVFGLLIGNANELPCLVKATVQWKEICYPFCQIWVCRHNDGSNRLLTLNFFAFWPYTMLNLEGSTFKLRTTSLNRHLYHSRDLFLKVSNKAGVNIPFKFLTSKKKSH